MKKEAEIKKNIYDLEYTKLINYLVISLVVIATLIITMWFSSLNLKFKVLLTAIFIPLAFLIGYLIDLKLNEIKEYIKNL